MHAPKIQAQKQVNLDDQMDAYWAAKGATNEAESTTSAADDVNEDKAVEEAAVAENETAEVDYE